MRRPLVVSLAAALCVAALPSPALAQARETIATVNNGPGGIARASNVSASATTINAPNFTGVSLPAASASMRMSHAHPCTANTGKNTNTNAAQNMRAVAPSADARACCSFIRRR